MSKKKVADRGMCMCQLLHSTSHHADCVSRVFSFPMYHCQTHSSSWDKISHVIPSKQGTLLSTVRLASLLTKAAFYLSDPTVLNHNSNHYTIMAKKDIYKEKSQGFWKSVTKKCTSLLSQGFHQLCVFPFFPLLCRNYSWQFSFSATILTTVSWADIVSCH